MRSEVFLRMTEFEPDQWIARFASTIQAIIRPHGEPDQELQWQKISTSPSQFLFCASNVSASFAIKVFDPSDTAARLSAKREAAVTTALQKHGLGPKLIGYSPTDCYLVRTWISGQTVSEIIDAVNLEQTAEQLGQFCASVGKDMPGDDFTMNWGEYLSRHDLVGDDLRDLEIAGFRIGDIEIGRRRIALNDAYLDNFILDSDGNITAVDFEASALKPAEWDLLLFARVLIKRFPTMVSEICAALANGYADGGGSIPHECLPGFLAAFGKATAFKETPYSQKSQKPTDHHVIHAPFMPQALVPVTEQERADLEAHILHEIGRASRSDEPDEESNDWQDNTNQVLAAMCANCCGKCCTTGLEAKAFITSSHLSYILNSEPDLEPNELSAFLINRIPEQHVAGSCLFSVPGGCALPRNRRSRVCNHDLCGQARAVAEISDLTRKAQSISIVSRSSTGDVRTRKVDLEVNKDTPI
jgi:hypothetical protein